MPPDHFALLDEARRPWLEPEPLRDKFIRLSAQCHPDRVHDQGPAGRQQAAQRCTALNAAYQCLREPKERLAHLLELESGRKPAGLDQVPVDMMELFMTVGQLNRDLSRFLEGKAKVTSPLLKAQWFQEALEWTERAQATLQALAARRNQLTERLRQLNDTWAAAPAVGQAGRETRLPLSEVEQSYRTLSFLTKWTAQLQEKLVQLTL